MGAKWAITSLRTVLHDVSCIGGCDIDSVRGAARWIAGEVHDTYPLTKLRFVVYIYQHRGKRWMSQCGYSTTNFAPRERPE